MNFINNIAGTSSSINKHQGIIPNSCQSWNTCYHSTSLLENHSPHQQIHAVAPCWYTISHRRWHSIKYIAAPPASASTRRIHCATFNNILGTHSLLLSTSVCALSAPRATCACKLCAQLLITSRPAQDLFSPQVWRAPLLPWCVRLVPGLGPPRMVAELCYQSEFSCSRSSQDLVLSSTISACSACFATHAHASKTP